jgi:hypothetical protein
MLTKLRPEKPVAGVTKVSLKPWLMMSASACAASAPPVPISVGLVKPVDKAPGCPAVPIACRSAATPESTLTVFVSVPTSIGVPVFFHVYAYVAGSSVGVSTFPTWKISEPTEPAAKYVLIRCAASVVVLK